MNTKNIFQKITTASLLVIAIFFFFIAGSLYIFEQKSISTPQISLTPTSTPIPIVKTESSVYVISHAVATIPIISTPTQTVQPIVTSTLTVQSVVVQIIKPDGNVDFSLLLKDNQTPCSVLNEAKQEGKIQSTTIIHYGPPLNSDYVKEINGYQDNWYFSINGEKNHGLFKLYVA